MSIPFETIGNPFSLKYSQITAETFNWKIYCQQPAFFHSIKLCRAKYFRTKRKIHILLYLGTITSLHFMYKKSFHFWFISLQKNFLGINFFQVSYFIVIWPIWFQYWPFTRLSITTITNHRLNSVCCYSASSFYWTELSLSSFFLLVEAFQGKISINFQFKKANISDFLVNGPREEKM